MKNFLFVALVASFLAIVPEVSFAKKKYRYIKREHGVQIQGNIKALIPPTDTFAVSLTNFQAAYNYNWRGMIEVGPYGKVASVRVPNFSVDGWDAGIGVHYNIIKNRGKRTMIPAIGLQVGYGSANKLNTSIVAALKYFVGVRTPIHIALSYNLSDLLNFKLSDIRHGVDLSVGFSYYFDIY